MAELAPERSAAREAVESLRLTPVLFELGARPHPPRALYRAYLEQSQVFVGIYWQRYGWIAPDMEVSGLHDEYLLCGKKPRLVYVKRPAPELDPRLGELLQEIEEGGLTSYRKFEAAEELKELLATDLALLLSEGFGWTNGAGTVPGETGPGIQRLPLPLTRLIGRERELEELSLLALDPRTRLLTITGAGGTGKSRLAIEAGRRLAERFPGGAVFVDLAPIRNAELFVPRLARALGIVPEGRRPLVEAVVESLGERPALLVVDNFEHVVEAGPVLASILAESPEVVALVTSRVPLRVRGEREYRAVPLPTPDPSTQRLERIAASESAQLFAERAADAAPDFALTEENAPAVAEICRRLDGLPLALELAAARVRVLPPPALLERLAGTLDLQAGQADLPERQRTLRATLDWSHALLDEAERALFARLAVFTGGWTLAAAEAICTEEGEPPVIDTLSSLVEKSLVAPDAPGAVEPRFRMLETVRAYAAERLGERGEGERFAERHGRYFADFCERAGPHLYERAPRLWLARLDAERENIRALSRWALDQGEHELLARAWTSTMLYWWVRDEHANVQSLFERILPLPPTASAKTRSAVTWLLGMVVAGKEARARTLFQEALELAREADDPQATAFALSGLGAVAPETGGPEGSWALHREALAIARRLDWRWGIAYSLHHLGDTGLRDRNPAAVIAYGTECLEISRELENEQMVAIALWQLGWAHVLEGDRLRARKALAESAGVSMRLSSTENMSYCLDGLAGVALSSGDAALAARLEGAADGARERVRIAPFPPFAPLIEGLRGETRAALGDSAFRAEHEKGATMSAEAALAAAMGELDEAEVGEERRPVPAVDP